MVHKRKQREIEERKDTAFLFNGWQWPEENIDRYEKRCRGRNSPLVSHPIGKPVAGRDSLRFGAK